ncbi:MAG: hypothetical protein KC506_01630 [Nanoarchaeota archaeon]|nr:hypothetical protein [Nanoarchaeota archaeon]
MSKGIIKTYSEYLKDNPKGYWFKRKLYGWGWIPAKWQGWVVVLAFIVVLLFNGFYLTWNGEPSGTDLTLFFGVLVVSIVLLIWICFAKGETPRWSWGR